MFLFFWQTIESFAAQEKQMEVCEVCGAFLIVGDAQSRVDDHLMGKQHMGYAKIKSTVEELKVNKLIFHSSKTISATVKKPSLTCYEIYSVF